MVRPHIFVVAVFLIDQKQITFLHFSKFCSTVLCQYESYPDHLSCSGIFIMWTGFWGLRKDARDAGKGMLHGKDKSDVT